MVWSGDVEWLTVNDVGRECLRMVYQVLWSLVLQTVMHCDSQLVVDTFWDAEPVQFLMQKPGSDVNSPSNYRPISNLNNMNGSFFSALTHALSSPHFIQLQSAYRKMHSCETALCKTLSHIYLSNDSGKCTLLVSLDLNAAFDTIGHNILLIYYAQGSASLVLHWHGQARREPGQAPRQTTFRAPPHPLPFPLPFPALPSSSPSLPSPAPSKAGIRGFLPRKFF